MNQFIAYLQHFSRTINGVKWLYNNKVLELISELDSIKFKVNLINFSQDTRLIVEQLLTNNQIANYIELYVLGCTLCNGPKIFRPRQFDLEMCEHIDINVPYNEYVQPFQTVIIELPDDYIKTKQTHDPAYDQNNSVHEPLFVILHKEPEILFSIIAFSSYVSIKSSFVFKNNKTIEEYFIKFQDQDERNKQNFEFEGSLETTMEEWKIIEDINRACINYCLLLDEIGIKKIGPQNGSEYERLQRYVKVANKTKNLDRINKARSNLQNHPTIYALNQEVKLVRSVKKIDETGRIETGRIISPHHRRGHYRTQHYGIGNSKVKRIRILPVFVNAHLFTDTLDKTKVIYE